MRFRKLRIAWSVMCGIACVLLLALWVRSYWMSDGLLVRLPNSGELDAYDMPIPRELGVESVYGLLSSSVGNKNFVAPSRTWRLTSEKAEDENYNLYFALHDLGTIQLSGRIKIVPHWIFVTILGALVAIPWIRWPKRFRIRTLLIATTVVAAVLGLIVHAIR